MKILKNMPVFIFGAALVCLGCKHKSAGHQKINIIVAGVNVNISPDKKSFTAEKSSSWASVKNRAASLAKAKDGFGIISWHLDSEAGEVIKDNYKFEKDTTVFADAATKLIMRGVSAIIDEDSVLLEWEDVPDADSYVLVWNGGNLKNVTSPHKETGLVKDGEYKFSIRAKGSGFADSEPVEKTLILNYFAQITPAEEGFAVYEDKCILPSDQPHWKGVIIPGRIIKLNPFKMGKYEVTYKLWKEVYEKARAKGYLFSEGQKGSDGNGSENQPVTKVSWRDCIVWCNAYTEIVMGEEHCVYRKGGKEGAVLKKQNECNNVFLDLNKSGYRLPTEAEWEYAARYKTDGGFQFLDRASGAKKPVGFETSVLKDETWKSLQEELTRVAVYQKWYDGDNRQWENQPVPVTKTASAGSLNCNELDLFDMSGNVSEWCFDWFHEQVTFSESLYKTGTITVNPLGAEYGSYRVYRGGNWEDKAENCCVGKRLAVSPDFGSETCGFRLVCR